MKFMKIRKIAFLLFCLFIGGSTCNTCKTDIVIALGTMNNIILIEAKEREDAYKSLLGSSTIAEPEIEEDEEENSSEVETKTTEQSSYQWEGEKLNAINGTVQGPSGKETYYNLPMDGVIEIMYSLGFDYEYWVREDGVKMYGPYIMCAANLELRPRGTLLQSTLGEAIVCDTGAFASEEPLQIDIAVDW